MLCTLIAAVVIGCLLPTTSVHAQSSASKELNRLFDEQWDWLLANNPGIATFVGDRRYNDRLGDQSAAAILQRRTEASEYLRRAKAIDPAELDATERVSRSVFIRNLTNNLEMQSFFGSLPLTSAHPITQRTGPQFGLPEMVRATRFTSVADYEAYLKRLGSIPLFLDQTIEQLRVGANSGWTPPRGTLADVPA
ncbi:MAG: DUF885 family protein, partial [Burkholderiaceae bacterium]